MVLLVIHLIMIAITFLLCLQAIKKRETLNALMVGFYFLSFISSAFGGPAALTFTLVGMGLGVAVTKVIGDSYGP